MTINHFMQTPPMLFLTMVPGLMLAIAFLQSGWDKVVQRQGNLDWFKGHFAKTILGKWPEGALTYLTIMELAAGILFPLCWIFYFLFPDALPLSFTLWSFFNGLTLVSLFLGQRLAGDYPGAANLNGYTMVYVAAGVLKAMLFLA